jgi:excisionase family DNA binding protein
MSTSLELLTVRETTALLKISRMLLYRLLSKGRIRCVRIGRCVRIPRTEIERLIRESEEQK